MLPVEVGVTDPTHPLFGRRFRLIAVTKTLALGAYARVECQPGTPLMLPLGVTSLSLSPAGERTRTKGPSGNIRIEYYAIGLFLDFRCLRSLLPRLDD